jgi:AcrR family transcriptional regulator
MDPVDPVERKVLIAKKAAEIIAAEGIDSATVRRIAAALQFSTRSITHYFEDKHQLLEWTCEYMEEEGYSFFSAPLKADPAALTECLVAMTAIDSKNRDLWKVYIAFWDRAARDPLFAERLQRWVWRANTLIAGVVVKRNPQRLDAEHCARLLIAFVNGISVQILLQPSLWTKEQVRQAIETYVLAILGPGN